VARPRRSRRPTVAAVRRVSTASYTACRLLRGRGLLDTPYSLDRGQTSFELCRPQDAAEVAADAAAGLDLDAVT